MNRLYNLMFVLFTGISLLAQTQLNISYSVNPVSFEENEQITVTFTGINESSWGVSTSQALYLWGWSLNAAGTAADCPTNGTWENSNEANKLTRVSAGVYSKTFTPSAFYARTGLKSLAMLVKTKTGNIKSQDIVLPVGKFQLNLTNPAAGSVNVVAPGSSVNITANTTIPSNFQLKSNGNVIHSTSTAATSYSYSYTVASDSNMELIATNAANSSESQSRTFTYLPTPTVQTAAMPAYMRQGISYDPADPAKVGLALYAPYKDFVHVIGSFNGWNISSNYLMKRSADNPNLFWTEITGLTPQQVYTFQYRTSDGVKVADPFSTLVLSPDDDPWISTSTYPNLPPYPAGQQYDVSVIQTAKPAYNWTATNFVRPAKENLIVYEISVRDFTTERNWQALINKIPYIKGLNVNAVELMPVMEFDGNNSWGYNTAFHLALDKAYGTPEKFKEFIDTCHQNGIAVILDVALNHATGRSPLERLWSTSSTGDYGDVAANNPYFNQTARHSYGVFYDFNHSKPETRYYVNRTLEQWISEYKIDGFRWDLTKGFTQNCTPSNEACTNAYQQDRVDVLKLYSDYQWSYDPQSYIIFEHLGTDSEEKEWANYRISEGKGVMTWDKLVPQYNQNTMGYTSDSNFNRVDFKNHQNFQERRNLSYAESHDEERLMYKNLQYGNSSGSYNIKNLNTALERQKAVGAVLLTVPGPKMIWQFGELGYDFSINRCEDGSVNDNCRTDPKPVPFAIGYDTNTNRKAIYDTWAKILELRLANEVFNTKTFVVESGNLMPRIYIWNDAIPDSSLKNVVILANFTLTSQNIVANFPYTGEWHNLMNGAVTNVTNTAQAITIEPGGFRIFGNKPSALATAETGAVKNEVTLSLLQNPVSGGVAHVRYTNADNGVLSVYDLSGKLVKTVKTTGKNGDEMVSVHDLKAGIYIIQLKSEKGVAVTKMSVK